ncbi:MAG: DUF2007 domain-containing protein [Blastocatellia bacterium]|nr:DUF2007 domain-containing protein [Blastocatellia bacterium]
MPFCPECEAEYKSGVTQCPDCGSNLVAEIATEDRVYDTSDTPLVIVKTFTTNTEAEMVQEVLQKEGVRSLLQGEVAASSLFPIPATAVTLLVDERDVERAKELIEAYFEAEISSEVSGDNTSN